MKPKIELSSSYNKNDTLTIITDTITICIHKVYVRNNPFKYTITVSQIPTSANRPYSIQVSCNKINPSSSNISYIKDYTLELDHKFNTIYVDEFVNTILNQVKIWESTNA